MRGLAGERIDAEPDAVTRLINYCARLPLALRIAAELADANTNVTFSELANELADERHRLDLLDTADDDPYAAVRVVFSWSYRNLAAAVRRAFRLLALHPGRDTELYALAALTGEHDRALTAYRQALDLSRDLDQPADEAHALDGLANAFHALGRYGTAREHWKRALDILSRLGQPAAEETSAASIRAHLAALGPEGGPPPRPPHRRGRSRSARDNPGVRVRTRPGGRAGVTSRRVMTELPVVIRMAI